MPIQLLERSQANAPDPDDPLENSASADLRFRTITDDDVQRLNDLFYHHHCALSRVAVSGAALAAGGAVLSGGGAFAAAGGAGADASEAAAASIAAGVGNAIEMIQAIDGIGLAAFGVALAPMGFMVTLRVLNMVLSRV
jgi:hypothetical protein